MVGVGVEAGEEDVAERRERSRRLRCVVKKSGGGKFSCG